MAKKLLSVGGGFIITLVETYLGGFDSSLELLLVAMVLDFLTGFGDAVMGSSSKTPNGKLSSQAMLKGIWKKVCELVLVVFGTVSARYLGEPAVRLLVINALLAAEGLSLLENLALAGVPMPRKLVEMLERLAADGN